MTFAPEWLALREPADALARAEDLVHPLRETLLRETRPVETAPAETRPTEDQPAGNRLNRTPVIIRDLGCGTGSMGRWLAHRLEVRQHWVLHDHDPRLLDLAEASMTELGMTAAKQEGDLAALRAGDLADTSLVTASALLDLLTADEVAGLAGACVGAGCPALLTLSVAGRVELEPAEPLDDWFAEAFNEHQRRTVDGRRLLGPDAVPVAVAAFQDAGAEVLTRPSPWRLGRDQAALTGQWLRGWVGAACEQDPDLALHAPTYLRRRLAGELRVVVHHTDLLALPRAA